MRRLLGVFTLALGVAGVTMQSGQAQPPPNPANAPRAAGFTQLFISPAGEPYRAKPGEPYPVAVWFKQADLNHDGVVTLEEFRADHAGFFSALDYDDAGVLDGGKISFYEKRVLPDVYMPSTMGLNDLSRTSRPRLGLALAQPDRDGAVLIQAQVITPQAPEGSHPNEDRAYSGLGAKGPAPELNSSRPKKPELLAAAYYGLLGEAEPIRDADTDLDGRVTKEEFMAAADRRFKLLDKRHDGKLTLDELPLTAAQIELAREEHRKP